MRGSIRKWWVMGTLASSALLFPGCADTNRGTDIGGQDPMGIGGAGMMEGQEGTGGSGIGGSGGAQKGGQDAGTPADAGTGGAGLEGGQETGSSGQGVSGDEGVTNTRTPSGGVPTK